MNGGNFSIYFLFFFFKEAGKQEEKKTQHHFMYCILYKKVDYIALKPVSKPIKLHEAYTILTFIISNTEFGKLGTIAILATTKKKNNNNINFNHADSHKHTHLLTIFN